MFDRLPEPLAGILTQFSSLLPEEMPFYLVGGAVRDLLRGVPVHDLDLVLPTGAILTARRLADSIGAAFYPLDVERDTARLVLMQPNQPRLVIDIAALRGGDLHNDLHRRDFTINALALNLRQASALIDPLGGAMDLHARRLRACSPTALQEDPVRVVRAVRLAFSLELKN